MSKEDLIKKLVQARSELNQHTEERKDLSEKIKTCKETEEKLIKALSENISKA